MIYRGKVWKFGDDINTDAIIPARYLNSSNPLELAKHCMEDADPDFVKKISKGDIIVGGKNFGCGSSREHAPVSIKFAGVSCVIAESFARIFFRNSFNMGLPIFDSLKAAKEASTGDEIEVDSKTGKIKNLTAGKSYTAAPIPAFMQDLISAGGLMNYVREKIKR
ncbi:MAG: 3-isopropylmalate dehydratase small subunit [Candidatus Auribacterota bacterium]|nr:3-isopropylmalate dehydratase small subunit [Candidatus Auribacterota bacterium]